MPAKSLAQRTCLLSNAEWRRQAGHLLAHASLPHLDNVQRAQLLREAAAARRQADMWLNGAIEAP